MPRVDHHAHFIPASYLRVVAEIDDGPWAAAANAFTARFGATGTAPAAVRDLGGRIADLDAAGIDTQLLSFGAGSIWHDDERTRRRLAAAFNEGVLEAAASVPGRFGLLASVALPHVSAAIAESVELARIDGVAGFGITAHPADRPIDDPSWRPLLECWSDLGATVLLHPDPVASDVLWGPYWLRWGFGAMVEDALVALRIVASGILIDFPGIRWIVPHAGGALPTAIGRLETMRRQGRLPERLDIPLDEALRGLWFDTATTDRRALAAAADALGPDRFVFGSDAPLGDPGGLAAVVASVREALGAHAEAVLDRDPRA